MCGRGAARLTLQSPEMRMILMFSPTAPARSALRRLFLVVPAMLAVLALAACGGSSGTATPAETDGYVEMTPAENHRLQVLASFYPLEFVAREVGGDYVDVQNLTPPAAEPHDLELSLAQARNIGGADVVLFLSGFQPAVDEAIDQQHPARVVDAADYVTLLPASDTGLMDEEDEEAEEGELGHEYGDEHDHEHGSLEGYDPHFWLDPTKLAQLAEPVAAAFSEADPDHAAEFEANAADLQARLTALDGEFADGLAPFSGSMLVTNHTAFGYLARRYGLAQVGIAGLDPETEPSPARMREIATLARENNVGTLFYESLASPRVVETLANDLGINVAELNPIEGLSTEEIQAHEDYFTVMRRNLSTLIEGLGH